LGVKPIISVWGNFFVTSERLIFVPYRFAGNPLTIPLSTIDQADVLGWRGLLSTSAPAAPGRVLAIEAEGKRYRFVLGRWAREVREYVHSAQIPPIS
jgi:hypothetical protein